MKYRIKNLTILLNTYLNSIKELIDFTLVQETKETKEKILVNIFFKLYFNLGKNNLTGPEFVNVYSTTVKTIIKNKIFRKKLSINDMNLENKSVVLNNFDQNKLKKTILFFNAQERMILYFMHNNFISPKELSLIFKISEGTIYSTISRTKKFIIKQNLKDQVPRLFKRKDECFFIENFLVKYNKNIINDEQKQKTSQHLKTCDECKTLFSNMKIIDEEISNFKSSDYPNITNKIYSKIHKSYRVQLFLKKLFINNITKTSLVLFLVLMLYKNIKIPNFKNNNNEVLLSNYLKEAPEAVAEKEIKEPEIVSENTEPLPLKKTPIVPIEVSEEPTIPVSSVPAKLEQARTLTLYKLSISSSKWQDIDNRLAQILNKFAAVKAGVIPLGSEKYGGTYYHFYVDQKDFDSFLKDVSVVASFEVIKEEETRKIPKDKARVVVWVGRTE